MRNYDVQQVCLNGHQITDVYTQHPESRKNFCDKCGESTIHECPECKHPIKGDYSVEDVCVVGSSSAPVPSHCENCGKPYPWSIPQRKATTASLPEKNDLHPWPIILSSLQALSSDDICRIVGLSGLQVDWNLTREEAHSHNTRKRAYLPKIQAAYNALYDDKKLAVIWLLVEELRKTNQQLISDMNTQLAVIGWQIGGRGLTTHDVDVREMFFPSGQQYDAYVGIKKIVCQSTISLYIIDPYIDSTIFQIMATISAPHLQVKLLSLTLSSDFILEAKKFLAQYSHFELEVKNSRLSRQVYYC